jgi:hypothetical protein
MKLSQSHGELSAVDVVPMLQEEPLVLLNHG